MKSIKLVSVLGGLGLFAMGCASQPPRELLDARAAYGQTAHSPNAPLVQTDVYEAKKRLDVAEAQFKDDGDSKETRDLSYIAQRRAMAAQAKGETAQAIANKKLAEADMAAFKDQQAAMTRGQLDAMKGQLNEKDKQLAAAENATREMLAKIQGMQQRLDDKGRTVLTLNGSVLFATGKSELLGTAQQKLQQVVEALKADKRDITILGHTDSVGNDDSNLALSQRRAEAVRSYLTSHGIPNDRVKAQGMGETAPIADNASPEGRANNRRVEIVLEDARGNTTNPNSPTGK